MSHHRALEQQKGTCAVVFFKHKILPQRDRISSVWSRQAGRICWFRANLEQYTNMITRATAAR